MTTRRHLGKMAVWSHWPDFELIDDLVRAGRLRRVDGHLTAP